MPRRCIADFELIRASFRFVSSRRFPSRFGLVVLSRLSGESRADQYQAIRGDGERQCVSKRVQYCVNMAVEA